MDYNANLAGEKIRAVKYRHVKLIRRVIPLYRAEVAWANELFVGALNLVDAVDVMRPKTDQIQQIPNTNFFFSPYPFGVGIWIGQETHDTMVVDLENAEPSAYVLKLFINRLVNHNMLSYSQYWEFFGGTEAEEFIGAVLKRMAEVDAADEDPDEDDED